MSNCIDHGRRGTVIKYAHVVHEGTMIYRHRLAYCLANAVSLEAIAGLVVRHTCDNPRCINPEHLLLGTQLDNVQDRQVRGRTARGAKVLQAKLTEADVLFIRDNYVRYSKEYSTVGLARKFSVNKATISRILNRELWAHV